MALSIVLTIKHGLEWCLCYEHIGQTCYNTCLFGICSWSQAMPLYIYQTKMERINHHILVYLSSIQRIQNQNKRRRSSMCICGQFISNDLDHTSPVSLKLMPVSNELRTITSRLHTITWLLSWRNELYAIIPSLPQK